MLRDQVADGVAGLDAERGLQRLPALLRRERGSGRAEHGQQQRPACPVPGPREREQPGEQQRQRDAEDRGVDDERVQRHAVDLVEHSWLLTLGSVLTVQTTRSGDSFAWSCRPGRGDLLSRSRPPWPRRADRRPARRRPGRVPRDRRAAPRRDGRSPCTRRTPDRRVVVQHLTALLGHLERRSQQRLRRGRAQTDDQLRVHHPDLGGQPRPARLDVAHLRRRVDPALSPLGEPEVLDGVGHVDLGHRDAGLGQRPLQQLAGRSDEGDALAVLDVTGLLADQGQPRPRVPGREDDLGGRLPQLAPPAVRRPPPAARRCRRRPAPTVAAVIARC